MNNTKKMGIILLAVSALMNAYAFYLLGWVEFILPWVILEIYVYYVSTTPMFLVLKLATLIASISLTFLSFQSLIDQDSVKYNNNNNVYSSKLADKVSIEARKNTINDPSIKYESIDEAYLIEKAKLNRKLTSARNVAVRYKGKRLIKALGDATDNCTSDTKQAKAIIKANPRDCGRLKKVVEELANLYVQYNSETAKRAELSILDKRYSSVLAELQQDGENNIKTLAVGLVSKFSDVFEIGYKRDELLQVADKLLLLFAIFLACLFSSVVMVAGFGEFRVIPKNISDGAKNSVKSLKSTVHKQYTESTERKKSPYTLCTIDTVENLVKIPTQEKIPTNLESSYRKLLVECLHYKPKGGKISTKIIRERHGCGTPIASLIFRTLRDNDLVKSAGRTTIWV